MTTTLILCENLKNLDFLLQSSKFSERKQTFEFLSRLISSKSLDARQNYEIITNLPLVLFRYCDSKSRRMVLEFIRSFCSLCEDGFVLKHLTCSLHRLFQRQITSSNSMAKISLMALNWLTQCVIMTSNEVLNSDGIDNVSLLVLISSLLTNVVSSSNTCLSKVAFKYLKHMWTCKGFVGKEETLKQPDVQEDIRILILISSYIDWLSQKGQSVDAASRIGSTAVEIILKKVITSKTKPLVVVIKNINFLIRHTINHEVFKSSLMPVMLKSLLRNPETIMNAVYLVLKGIRIDLSIYVRDLLKPLTQNLQAKDALLREETSLAVAALASHCSDGLCVNEIVKALFSIIESNFGQLYKVQIVETIGCISVNNVTGSSFIELCSMVVDKLLKILTIETQESMIIQTLECLSIWASMFRNELPSSLVSWIVNGLYLKSASPAIRFAYLKCIEHIITKQSYPVESTLPVLPIFLKAFDIGWRQTAHLAVISDSILAANCIIRLSALPLAHEQIENSNFWKLVQLGTPLVGQKILINLDSQTLTALVTLTENVFKFFGTLEQPYIRVIVLALTSTTGSSLRLIARKSISKMSADVLINIVHDLGLFLQSQSELILGSFVVSALWAIAIKLKEESSSSDELLMKLALSLIVPCHTPIVFTYFPSLWSNILNKIDVAVADLLNQNPVLLSSETIEASYQQTYFPFIIRDYLKLCPAISVTLITNYSIQKLLDPALLISASEFAIYRTPEGVLYDDSSVAALKNDNLSSKNIKRESKVYSYKEQMEDMALRREIEDKKGLNSLNNKQMEAFQAQLSKETIVREKVSLLNSEINPVICLLKNSFEFFSHQFTDCVHLLVPALITASKSLLISDQCLFLFALLRKSVFTNKSNESLSQMVAGVTGILYSTCKMYSNSNKRHFGISVLERIYKLRGVSCPNPMFAYLFPLIKTTILLSTKNDDNICLALNIIKQHALFRGQKESDFDHPIFLPRKEIINLLFEIIPQISPSSQQQTITTISAMASAMSGQTGCVLADENDINILLGYLENELVIVREAALRGLANIDFRNFMTITNYHRRVWIAKFDPDENIKDLASDLWTNSGLYSYVKGETLRHQIIQDVIHPVECIRSSAAPALAVLLSSNENAVAAVTSTIDELIIMYKEQLPMLPPVLDSLGRVVHSALDNWQLRCSVAVALKHLAPLFCPSDAKLVTDFVCPLALGDRSEVVRRHILSVALDTVNVHGKVTSGELLPVFENFLQVAPSSSNYDNIRQSVVVLMGSLAKHLDKDDPKVRPIVKQLILALNTPSQQVQEAVANCLPPLIPCIGEEAPDIVTLLIETLFSDQVTYGERKGAAYGIAGIVKGLGILSLKQLTIMTKLTEAISDKKRPKRREGALFALEMLCNMLGRLFEPYVVHILPHLLLCFGDSIEHIRQAADDTAKAVMSKLSAHGVKLVLPALLNALEEDQWRTKAGSIELLGAMAHCAPKQLSSCLPSIVPRLIEVLGDSHQRVQRSGIQALSQIGAVIKNPEIQAIVPALIKAFKDPSKETGNCLLTLLDTKFVHFIDAPSLALIMPVVERAFVDRSTETRKMAAQIIGNMYSLTDQKDLSPYMPGIVPGLKASLLDPVPEVRGVSARALGAMVKGMGSESCFDELLPWLMTTLTSDASSVDRSGAAQGLAEVVGALGVEKMSMLMPDIISTAGRIDIAPHVKDGYLMMFIYIPGVFPDEFTKYIGQIISPVLLALADENEFLRETAYKAGQRLVVTYADTAISLLLPELEKGLINDNWRIRNSSVQLLGDLLYKISGVSGKMSTESECDDDNFGTEASQKNLVDVLGIECRNRVLSGLYMCRCDTSLMVRQASLHVWKVVVTNTPKTLREILPMLFNLLLTCLASNSYDKRQVAARTLGDLVKKLGERVLPEIIPILECGLDSDDSNKRQGVCVGLTEILESTSKDMVLNFVESLVPTVRRALCDELPEVREAAAKTFDSLHNVVGLRALDEILPSLLQQLEIPSSHENALDGLRQVLSVKSRAVLPYLIPQLLSPPVNTDALSSLAPVAGECLHQHLTKIISAMFSALNDCNQDEDVLALKLSHTEAVILSVTDTNSDSGITILLDELTTATKSKQLNCRRNAAALLHAFCSRTKVNYEPYVPGLLRCLIILLSEEDIRLLTETWNALSSITKTVDALSQMSYVGDVRQAVRFAVSEYEFKDEQGHLPGFCLAKGIAPILPIFRESILNGSPDLKEQAALGLGEIIKISSPDALKPSVVQITGPLIRVLGDRFGGNVKTAVLDTLAILLSKTSIMLKPFFPQLQTTFMKALNDVTRAVRLKAGNALTQLITIHTRPDPLFNELFNGIKNAEDSSVRDTYLQAMRGCVTLAGNKISLPIRNQIIQLLLSLLSHTDSNIRTAAAGCLGCLLFWLPVQEDDQLRRLIIRDELLKEIEFDDEWILNHGRSTCLFVALKMAPEKICSDVAVVVNVILSHLASDRVQIARNGVRSAGYLFYYLLTSGESSLPVNLIGPFCKSINHSTCDVKIMFAKMCSFLAEESLSSSVNLLPPNLLKPILLMLVNGTKEKNTAVKASCESALICVLKLRSDKDGLATFEEAKNLLEPGARNSLQDVYNKTLLRLLAQPPNEIKDVIDDTMLII